MTHLRLCGSHNATRAAFQYRSIPLACPDVVLFCIGSAKMRLFWSRNERRFSPLPYTRRREKAEMERTRKRRLPKEKLQILRERQESRGGPCIWRCGPCPGLA